MNIQSLKWDKVNEFENMFEGVVRLGATFSINSKSVVVKNLSTSLVALQSLLLTSKNDDNSPQLYNGVMLTHIELYQLAKNIATYISEYREYKDLLCVSVNNMATIELVDNSYWNPPVIVLRTDLDVNEDITEHHDDRYYTKVQVDQLVGASHTYSFSGQNTYTINHNFGYIPMVSVSVGGAVVMTEINHTNVNSLTVTFSKTTACEITIS